MSQIRPLIPLLVTAGILIGGNGLQGTFISLRALEEGFSTSLIGVIGAGYNVGFAIGCVYVTRILRAIGHIRTFSAMAAIASAAAIAMVLVIDPWFWFLMRLVAGICFASLFATVESWLNASVTNGNRARTLSIYRLVDLGSVTAAQYAIPGIGIGGFELFAIISMALTLSLVPISFADRSSPVAPEAIRFDVKALWNISPLATIGCIVVGLTNAAFRSLGPIYAQEIGLSVTAIATFMSAGIIGGVVLQYPLGYYSDRIRACQRPCGRRPACARLRRHALFLVARSHHRAAPRILPARDLRTACALHLYGSNPGALHGLHDPAHDRAQTRSNRGTVDAVSQPSAHIVLLQQACGRPDAERALIR